MSIYEHFDSLGKSNITATGSDFIDAAGISGIKDMIRQVLLGENVRDVTEFVLQRRLVNSYAATLRLFLSHLHEYTDSPGDYANMIANDLADTKERARTLDLWLLGLTKKGLDNIVRAETNIAGYADAFAVSVAEAAEELSGAFGELSGRIVLGQDSVDIDWQFLSLLFLALGAQTLTIRGSAKSMNGKLFEKLVLGSLLTICGYQYRSAPPESVARDEKIFWLSSMDEHARETDATVVYDGKAVSIDIGFIGKGNPEITLDKVTRFGAYKEIGGVRHDMSTIIIVDTVAENSDLFFKAEQVRGHVLQMKQRTWTQEFAKLLNEIMGSDSPLLQLGQQQLDAFFKSQLSLINIAEFVAPKQPGRNQRVAQRPSRVVKRPPRTKR